MAGKRRDMTGENRGAFEVVMDRGEECDVRCRTCNRESVMKRAAILWTLIPSCKACRYDRDANAARDAEIRRLRAAGAALRDIGARYGLSAGRVHQIVKAGGSTCEPACPRPGTAAPG